MAHFKTTYSTYVSRLLSSLSITFTRLVLQGVANLLANISISRYFNLLKGLDFLCFRLSKLQKINLSLFKNYVFLSVTVSKAY